MTNVLSRTIMNYFSKNSSRLAVEDSEVNPFYEVTAALLLNYTKSELVMNRLKVASTRDEVRRLLLADVLLENLPPENRNNIETCIVSGLDPIRLIDAYTQSRVDHLTRNKCAPAKKRGFIGGVVLSGLVVAGVYGTSVYLPTYGPKIYDYISEKIGK
jgi:hypothetical protein